MGNEERTMAKMWAGRTSGEVSTIADDFNSSIRFDYKMYRQDITGSMAHAAMLGDEDILLVMADHGNDPNIGHNKHTRENVPLLVYRKGVTGVNLGLRKSLSDVGATVCDFFGVKAPQNGQSFLEMLK